MTDDLAEKLLSSIKAWIENYEKEDLLKDLEPELVEQIKDNLVSKAEA